VPAVREIMARDVLAVEPATRLLDAAGRMHERNVGAVVVVEGGRLVGIFTERDVLRAVATGRVEGPWGTR
jgi:CBS domain-containing protein